MTPRLLDTVALLEDRPDLGLAAGQTGTVVLAHGETAFEVEFADADGKAVALATLPAESLLRLLPNPKVAA